MRPLHVVHLVEALGTGGLERVVQTLKDELRRRGHEITCRRTAEA